MISFHQNTCILAPIMFPIRQQGVQAHCKRYPPANVKFRTCMNSIFNFCAVKPPGEVASGYTLQQILATFFRFRCLNLIRHYSIKSQFMVQDSLTMRLMIQIWYLCISINPFKFFLAKVELDSHFFPPSSYWKMLMLAFQIYSPINSF